VRIAVTVSTLIVAAFSAAATADQPVEINEWKVPYERTRPRDPFAESADSVWFVGQGGGYLGHLDVGKGEFSKVALKPGSGPHNLIVGNDGIVWYAGNRTALIGRYDPASGEIEEIEMPDSGARDPHTLVFDAAEENIWFTVQAGNMMGRLNIATRRVDLIRSPFDHSRPYGIKIAPDGTPWVVLFGTHRLARIEPETLELTTIDLPREDARPRRILVTSDGRIWYGDYRGGMLGAYDPRTGQFAEWPLPQGKDARPYGMATDSRDRIWLVATGVQPNVFLGFDPDGETFFSSTPVPSGGGTIRHMYYHEPTGAIWFGTDTNNIGRAIVEADK
jgi:virginiamycin B lyase